MTAGEAAVTLRVPILGCDDKIELTLQLVDWLDNLITPGGCQRPSWQEVILHVDND
jgi:hypothetical protein